MQETKLLRRQQNGPNSQTLGQTELDTGETLTLTALLVPHEYEGGDTVEGGDEKIREGEGEEEIIGDCPHRFMS